MPQRQAEETESAERERRSGGLQRRKALLEDATEP